MYIDTHSKDSMQTSICAYLNTSLEELQKLFDYVSHEAQQDLYFDAGKANALFTDFVQEKIPETPINEILFFHLSFKKPPFRKIGRDNTFETVETAGTAAFPTRLISDLITLP